MLSEGQVLSEREVLAALGGPAPAGAGPTAADDEGDEEAAPLDHATIEQALQQAGGNRAAAARLLHMSRRALYRRLDAFGLR